MIVKKPGVTRNARRVRRPGLQGLRRRKFNALVADAFSFACRNHRRVRFALRHLGLDLSRHPARNSLHPAPAHGGHAIPLRRRDSLSRSALERGGAFAADRMAHGVDRGRVPAPRRQRGRHVGGAIRALRPGRVARRHGAALYRAAQLAVRNDGAASADDDARVGGRFSRSGYVFRD